MGNDTDIKIIQIFDRNINATDRMIIRLLLGEIERNKGMIKVSKLPVTKSKVLRILNLLQMFDIIEYGSFGVKGTFIKIKNIEIKLYEREGEG